MNTSTAENAVQWLFLDLNTFFASCEQQENPALRNQPVIVVQTVTDSAVAIYAAKAFGIKTGTLMREARQLCPPGAGQSPALYRVSRAHSQGRRQLPPHREGVLDRRDGLPPDGHRTAGAGCAGISLEGEGRALRE